MLWRNCQSWCRREGTRRGCASNAANFRQLQRHGLKVVAEKYQLRNQYGQVSFRNTFIQPLPAWNLRQRRPQCSRRAGIGRNRSVACKKLSTFRADEFAVPLRILQHPQSHEIQRAESSRLRIRHRRTIAHCRSDHIHCYNLTPSPVRTEVAVVKAVRSEGTLTHE
jgi:hypothetical protein